jgi:oxepin-CoA hydrolase/3-oxo-5,6-dehydrosuberyl-CoA semialdehyde dehydrogenase
VWTQRCRIGSGRRNAVRSSELANYGLDTLRFVKPVGIGDTIRARLTCKRKTDKPPRKGQPPQGVVAWDVQVTNQDGELVASYDILTLVLKRPDQAELTMNALR